ncbi:MAG: hypothetical protein FD167_1206, partial [bacterium]
MAICSEEKRDLKELTKAEARGASSL